MYEDRKIEELFGSPTLEYLKNKNQGGVSNNKGNTYENFFAVYQLALLAKAVIEDGKDIYFLSQVCSFVDDLIIHYVNEDILQHYQLKNSPNINWGTGAKSICDDFRKQFQLNESISKKSELSLVVSSSNLQSELHNKMPEEIKNYSQVKHFHYDANLMKVINQEPEFKKAVEYLCCFDNPEQDKIECVVSVLLGAWCSSDRSNTFVLNVLKKAQNCNPSYVRSFTGDKEVDSDVKEILDRIEFFTYRFSKGFLHWKYRSGLDEGTLPYNCATERFTKFQNLVREKKPSSFDELESFLI
jgi:hypothetical protein